MKQLISTAILSLILSAASPLAAQTLDRLHERAMSFYALRASGNKIEAEKYVEPQGLAEFRTYNEPTITKAEVTSIEFSKVPTVVTVVTRLQVFDPRIGPFERSVRESWVWNGTDWYLHIEPPSPNPFEAAATSPLPKEAPRKDLQIAFLKHEVDLGRHSQGEIISGRLEFRGDQKEIAAVRPADLQGLTFDPVKWQGADLGILEFKLDTVLMSESFQKSLRFVFVDSAGGLHTAMVDLRATIDAHVRFTQIPKTVDTRTDGICVLQIQNLTAKPVRLLAGTITNSDFRLASAPDSILPHEVGTIQISYSAQAQASGASLNLKFSEDLLGKRMVMVPLQIGSGPSAPATYTREELDAIRRKANP